mmetsp:Transcript_43363/g.85547  ORF Transcript_43363/g.85547 Transcript_43363/m.85547 type:complete len:229 (-) Transcript_43363:139-825(-)
MNTVHEPVREQRNAPDNRGPRWHSSPCARRLQGHHGRLPHARFEVVEDLVLGALLSVVKVEPVAVEVDDHEVRAASERLDGDVPRETVAAQREDAQVRHDLPESGRDFSRQAVVVEGDLLEFLAVCHGLGNDSPYSIVVAGQHGELGQVSHQQIQTAADVVVVDSNRLEGTDETKTKRRHVASERVVREVDVSKFEQLCAQKVWNGARQSVFGENEVAQIGEFGEAVR